MGAVGEEREAVVKVRRGGGEGVGGGDRGDVEARSSRSSGSKQQQQEQRLPARQDGVDGVDGWMNGCRWTDGWVGGWGCVRWTAWKRVRSQVGLVVALSRWTGGGRRGNGKLGDAVPARQWPGECPARGGSGSALE